jgi:hypothetical protein
VTGTELAAYYDGRKRMMDRRPSFGSTTMTSSINSSTMAASVGRKLAASRVRSHSYSKWRAESNAFREAIRQAKIVSQAERQAKATGIPLHILLPPSSKSSLSFSSYAGDTSAGYRREMPAGYMQCPHCRRSFNQKAGERHIPQVSFHDYYAYNIYYDHLIVFS